MRNAGVSQSAFMQMAIGERHPIETEIYSRCVDGAFIGLADVSSEASRNVLCWYERFKTSLEKDPREERSDRENGESPSASGEKVGQEASDQDEENRSGLECQYKVKGKWKRVSQIWTQHSWQDGIVLSEKICPNLVWWPQSFRNKTTFGLYSWDLITCTL